MGAAGRPRPGSMTTWNNYPTVEPCPHRWSAEEPRAESQPHSEVVQIQVLLRNHRPDVLRVVLPHRLKVRGPGAPDLNWTPEVISLLPMSLHHAPWAYSQTPDPRVKKVPRCLTCQAGVSGSCPHGSRCGAGCRPGAPRLGFAAKRSSETTTTSEGLRNHTIVIPSATIGLDVGAKYARIHLAPRRHP